MSIAADLRQILGPDSTIIDDPKILPSYSKDQSQIADWGLPECVLLARNSSEIAKTVKYAYENKIPVVPRGAGSGLAGGANSITGSIVISLEKMAAIVEIDEKNLIARVQPGVINSVLDQEVARLGLAYLPDPASREWSTIGGNVATNAGGMCCVKYGVTSHHVRAITAVIGDGSIISLGHRVKKYVTGLDLLHLFIGSEGTLGIVTEITVALVPRPQSPVTMIATFPDVSSAARAIPELVSLQPSMLEIIDRTTIEAVESWKPLGFEKIGAALIMQSDIGAAPCQRGIEIAQTHGALDATFSDDPRDSADLVAIRKLAYPALERLGAALLDDVCVPITAIAELVTEVEKIAAHYELLIGIFGHAGDGNMHPTIVYQHNNPESEKRARAAFAEIIGRAQKLGGTASGEHGIGSIKRSSAELEYGPDVARIQREIKSIFDPHGIMNPGKKLS